MMMKSRIVAARMGGFAGTGRHPVVTRAGRSLRAPASVALRVAVLIITGAFLPGCHASGVTGQVSPEQQKRLEAVRERGRHAPLTVFPVVMMDSAVKDVADVVALLLEKAGMTELETTDAIFRLPRDATFDDAAELFGEFVRDNAIATEYAVYAEFVGTPKTGPKEIRGVIVDNQGRTVLVDRQTSADREFKRAKPRDPMTCCQFLAERIRVRLDIAKSARDDSGAGRFARMFAENSPGPDQAERAAIERRQAAMKSVGRRADVAVYPVRHSDDEVGKTDATELAKLLSEGNVCNAHAVHSPLRVAIQPSHNEQEWLWDLANAFRAHIRQNPPEADYAILADYIMHPSEARAWAVHFVVCDREGEWVIVDLQNNHHGDFQSIDPKSYEDCGRLVAKRLRGYLR